MGQFTSITLRRINPALMPQFRLCWARLCSEKIERLDRDQVIACRLSNTFERGRGFLITIRVSTEFDLDICAESATLDLGKCWSFVRAESAVQDGD